MAAIVAMLPSPKIDPVQAYNSQNNGPKSQIPPENEL